MAKKSNKKDNKSNTEKQALVYEIMTKAIIDQLDKGTVPWHMPWTPGEAFPIKHVSGKRYRGVNVFLLNLVRSVKGYTSNRWLSFKQAIDKGGNVRKGEQGTRVVFWKMLKVEDKETGELKHIPFLRYHSVFNVEQCDGIEIPAIEVNNKQHKPIKACERVVSSMPNRPPIKHGESRAYYVPSKDFVNMPKKSLFDSAEEYYSTLFHELAHSTGHSTRLNRNGDWVGHAFGSKDYSKEELVAEMTAAFLAGITGIEQKTLDNSAAYINNWKKRLKGDVKLVVQAASKAQQAADYITGVQYDENGVVDTQGDDSAAVKRAAVKRAAVSASTAKRTKGKKHVGRRSAKSYRVF